ncbi:methyltransferase [Comamonas sp. GB3 AK4-5]|uniref:methyltransferase n=1 Tax=Comamonas sp. GB3 AK4-5 TaxID=3231487 RepID=UPI00351EEE5A
MLQWQHQGKDFQAAWHSESAAAAPRRLQVVDDSLSADTAYRLACEGTALLWQGDFQNARHLLDALKRRLDKPVRAESAKARHQRRQVGAKADAPTFPHAFHLYRQSQAQRARVLNSLLVVVQPDYVISLRRAPDWKLAFNEAWGAAAVTKGPRVVALRELLGVVAAHEWRKKGVPMPLLGDDVHIHAHYGVFSPVRGEYLDLVAEAPLPAAGEALAFDIGVGTGVLSALLLQRGVERVVATDLSPRAISCAKDNFKRMGLSDQVDLQACDLFPEGQAGLIVCNPPWLPGKANTTLEQSVYDPDSRMLRGFLQGLRAHLAPQGEGWLILSDLAEHLGLRSRAQLETWIAEAGLKVLERRDTRPTHGKAQDASDPLHSARAQEVTSLWRLAAQS